MIKDKGKLLKIGLRKTKFRLERSIKQSSNIYFEYNFAPNMQLTLIPLCSIILCNINYDNHTNCISYRFAIWHINIGLEDNASVLQKR